MYIDSESYAGFCKFGINKELSSEYPPRFYSYRIGGFGDVTWSGRL